MAEYVSAVDYNDEVKMGEIGDSYIRIYTSLASYGAVLSAKE